MWRKNSCAVTVKPRSMKPHIPLKAELLNLLLPLAPVTFMTADETQRPNGALLYRQFQCHVCHGEGGALPVEEGYPVITGQNRTYLTRQLIDIRDGIRDNGQTRLMRPLMTSMTDADAAAIARYLSDPGK